MLLMAQDMDEIRARLKEITPAEQIDYLQPLQPQLTSLSLTDQAEYWYQLGMAYDQSNRVEPAIDAYTRAIELYEHHDLPLTHILPRSYVERSYMKYVQTNDPLQYCDDRFTALMLVRQLDNPELLVKILIQNAFCYADNADDLNQGLALLVEALGIAEKHGLSKRLYGMVHNASGVLYRDNQLLDKAYEYITKAYRAWAELDDYQDMFNMLHSLISLAIELKRFDLARGHVEQLFELAQTQPQFADFWFFSHYNAGQLALEQQEFELAVIELDKALALRHTTHETFFVNRARQMLAVAHFKLLQHEQAEAALLQLAEEQPDIRQWPLLHQALQRYYGGEVSRAMGLMSQALYAETLKRRDFVVQYHRAATTLFNENIVELDNRLLQKDLEINRLQLMEEQSQRRFAQFTIGFAFVLLAVMFGFILHLLTTRRKLSHRAQTDYLTRIANRRFIFEQGHELVSKARERQQPLSLLLFDVDHFKQVNDSLGHEEGDKALKLVSQRASGCLRQHDRIGRIGGEEFLVLLPDTEIHQAQQIAQRMRKEIEKTSLRKDDQPYSVTISIGTATLMEGESLEDVIRRADEALYQAKQNGRNQVVLAV